MRVNVFRDFDAFAEDIRNADVEVTLKSLKRRVWSVTHLDLAGLHVQRARLGSGHIAEGRVWADGYLLYLPRSDSCEYVGNGTSFSKGDILVMEPGAEICITTQDEHDWCTIRVPVPLARGRGLFGASSRAERPACWVARRNPQLADLCEALVRDAAVASATCPAFESSSAARRAVAAALRIVSSVVGKSRAGERCRQGRPRASRREIVWRCEEALEEHGTASVLVSELATAAGVSERTLRQAFDEYFGVGPARYLQLKRLHAVHRALRAADPDEKSVTGIMVDHGEWQFGRLASQYHRLFGELPSETLRSRSLGPVGGPLAGNRDHRTKSGTVDREGTKPLRSSVRN